MRRLAFACAVLAVGSIGIDAVKPQNHPAGSLDLKAEPDGRV